MTTLHTADCPPVATTRRYYRALADVGWLRFYELGIGNTKPEGGSGSEAQILQAMRESELGLPVIVHASPVKDKKLLPAGVRCDSGLLDLDSALLHHMLYYIYTHTIYYGAKLCMMSGQSSVLPCMMQVKTNF